MGGFHAPGIYNACTRHRVSSAGFSHLNPQRIIDALIDAILLPRPKIIIDGLPVRKISRQHPPRTAAALDVEDGIHNVAAAVSRWTTTWLGCRDERFNDRPLFVAHVTGITRGTKHFLSYTLCIQDTVTCFPDSLSNPIIYNNTKNEEVSIYLIEEIMKRLEKTKLEWIYCYRYLRNIIKTDSIYATVSILVNNPREHKKDIIDVVVLNLGEEGYPLTQKELKNKDERLDSAKLKIFLNSERERRLNSAS